MTSDEGEKKGEHGTTCVLRCFSSRFYGEVLVYFYATCYRISETSCTFFRMFYI